MALSNECATCQRCEHKTKWSVYDPVMQIYCLSKLRKEKKKRKQNKKVHQRKIAWIFLFLLLFTNDTQEKYFQKIVEEAKQTI